MPAAFQADGPGSWTMNHYTENPRELPKKFDEIAYKKAACVLRMIMDFMTFDVFMNGLRIYLTDNYMSAVGPDDLHRALEKAYDPTETLILIGNVMAAWENQAGYPLVSGKFLNEFRKLFRKFNI